MTNHQTTPAGRTGTEGYENNSNNRKDTSYSRNLIELGKSDTRSPKDLEQQPNFLSVQRIAPPKSKKVNLK